MIEGMQTRRILWAALLASTFVYLLVLVVVAKAPHTPPDPILATVFAVLALGSVAIAFVLPSRLFAQGLATLRFETSETGTFGDRPAGTRVFTSPDRARSAAQPALQTTFVLRMAMLESVALYGFVLGFLGHPTFVYLPFFVLAWALMAMQFPTSEADDAAITKGSGIHFP